MKLKEEVKKARGPGSVKKVDGKLVYDQYVFEGRQVWHTREDGSLDVSTINDEPSLTQQQFVEQCDVNTIMKSYAETGTINHLNPAPGVYGDFSEIGDLRESLAKIDAAQAVFDMLPAKVRARFDNDAMKLIDFCKDPKNLDEAISLGLAEKKATTNTTTINDDVKQTANPPPSA